MGNNSKRNARKGTPTQEKQAMNSEQNPNEDLDQDAAEGSEATQASEVQQGVSSVQDDSQDQTNHQGDDDTTADQDGTVDESDTTASDTADTTAESDQQPAATDDTPPPAPAAETQAAPQVTYTDSEPGALPAEVGVITNRLQRYAEKMGPACENNAVSGGKHQALLGQIYMRVLRSSGADFSQNMSELLEFVRANRNGVFSDGMVYRFMDSIPVSKDERYTFEHLTNLFINACNIESRALVMRQVDLNVTLAKINDEGIRQRVFEYFAPGV